NNRRFTPLLNDATLFAGLTEGDYYLAVTSGANTPDPLFGRLPGQGGVFDPLVSQSGFAASRAGPYVLRLQLVPDEAPPEVAAVTQLAEGAEPGLPTRIVVRFSEMIDPLKLLEHSTETTPLADRAVWVHGADGKDYYPHLESVGPGGTQATFL